MGRLEGRKNAGSTVWWKMKDCVEGQIGNEIPKQSQCFSNHQLLMLSQHLSQVNMEGGSVAEWLGHRTLFVT